MAMLQNRQPLTPDDLRKKVPSVFATKASPKMGEKYTFIPSSMVVASLEKMGLVPVEASQRSSQEAATARHLIRFARKDDLIVKAKREVGEVIPEVVFSNSHNGRCKAKLFFGMFRLVCSNGLIVADRMFAGMEARHSGMLEAILAKVEEVMGRTGEVMKSVNVMQRTKLTDNARTEFAMAALALRYADEDGKVVAPVTAQDLLVPRREADHGHDLWHTFNVVQENMLRGGLEGKAASGRIVRTREVHDVRKVLMFNTELWALAAERIPA